MPFRRGPPGQCLFLLPQSTEFRHLCLGSKKQLTYFTIVIFVVDRGSLGAVQSRYIRTSSSIPPYMGLYPKVGSDVNKLSAQCGQV